ncbi:transcriptional regulator NrdR [Candidatus Margulisiibacteriota bacterium]
MKCPSCGNEEDKVLESRAVENGTVIRRRRECLKCESRHTSYERVEERPLIVIKKDGERQPFSREKIRAGILRATEKRPVSIDQVNNLINSIEKEVRKEFVSEVPTNNIGKLVMEKLQELDEVAYVRFASVYRKFESITDFVEEVKALK